MKKLLVAGISSSLGIFSAAALALGLGNVVVESNLNEPLRAEIPLVTRPGEDISDVQISLASSEDFERVGLDRSLLAVPLAFSLDNSGAEPVIRVTSSQSVRDPFLNFLIEVNWPRGRLLREYTLLLDPPVLAPSIAQEAPASPVSTSSLPDDEPEEIQEPAVAMQPEPVEPAVSMDPDREREGSMASSRSAGVSDTYGPVGAGETLWEIADKTRPAGVSVQEMMLALLRANPEAFGEGNINYLKRGSVLRVPDDAGGMTRADVIAQIQTQNELWEAYRDRLSGRVSQVADSASGSTFGSSAAESGASGSRLELLAPGDDAMGSNSQGGSGSDSAAGLRAELARAREDLATSSAENNELSSRVDELEGLVAELERMVSIKDADLAELQAVMGDGTEASVQDSAIAADLGEVVDEVSDAADSAGEAVSDVVNGVDTSDPFGFGDMVEGEDAAADIAAADPLADPIEEDSAEDVTPVREATPVPTVQRRPEPTLVERLMQWWFVPAGLAVLALLAGLLWWRGRSGKSEQMAVDLSADDDIDQFSNELDDLSDDLDLDGPDEMTLLDDIAAQPDDPQRRLLLLRRYYAEGEADKFEEQARALRDYVSNDDHPVWTEVKTMGSRLLPGVALFDIDEGAEITADAPEIAAEASADAESDSNFPFDDDLDDAKEAAGEALESAEDSLDGALEFDLDEADEALGIDFGDDAPEQDDTPTGEASDDVGLDLGLDLDDAASDLEGALDEASAIDLDAEDELPPLEFDVGDDLSESVEDAADELSDMAAEPETTELNLEELVGEPATEELSLSLEDDDDDDLGAIEFDVSDLDTGSDDAASDAIEDAADQLDDVAATAELPSIDLDDDELFEGEDTVSTKLDLAKAYIDMGDPDGARGMLEEVVAEGSDQQRDEAERLIEALD